MNHQPVVHGRLDVGRSTLFVVGSGVGSGSRSTSRPFHNEPTPALRASGCSSRPQRSAPRSGLNRPSMNWAQVSRPSPGAVPPPPTAVGNTTLPSICLGIHVGAGWASGSGRGYGPRRFLRGPARAARYRNHRTTPRCCSSRSCSARTSTSRPSPRAGRSHCKNRRKSSKNNSPRRVRSSAPASAPASVLESRRNRPRPPHSKINHNAAGTRSGRRSRRCRSTIPGSSVRPRSRRRSRPRSTSRSAPASRRTTSWPGSVPNLHSSTSPCRPRSNG